MYLLVLLTGKLSLVEVYDGFWAACASNSDFLLPAILLKLVLDTRQKTYWLDLHRQFNTILRHLHNSFHV